MWNGNWEGEFDMRVTYLHFGQDFGLESGDSHLVLK